MSVRQPVRVVYDARECNENEIVAIAVWYLQLAQAQHERERYVFLLGEFSISLVSGMVLGWWCGAVTWPVEVLAFEILRINERDKLFQNI